ncbi:winged helix-turn-helix domain-containing protein [Caulobacter sp.]|uniref:winged helix-turn-helix domain-containing protein n=1 Tax=Caulobacter sp. TaxID=78 RepID=UPI001B06D48D|nr:winged helix-turn-helix domain-containing protein [Caulobacter sp.]MBO9547719.1 YcaQ family DNA glycosylase [Caulobacter sp.]
MVETLSAKDARRIALAAQGFGRPRPAAPGRRHLLSTIEALGVVQIDSVNVLSRSHYLPFFSRLGSYDRTLLDDLAWGKKRALAEYWAHEASLTPLWIHPQLRWRMEDAAQGVGVWKNVSAFLHSHADFIEQALAAITERGPMAASELELGAKGAGGWWGWSEGKRAMECLFWTGRLTTATRRGSFERVYDLPDRVLWAVSETPTPDRGEAHRSLLATAGKAMGVSTERDLRDYFRLGVADTRKAVAELVEETILTPVKVEGWDQPAYLWPYMPAPRRVKASALLSPFDNLIWFRERTERMFGVRVRLEIYTPAHKRTHGYYVLPFLQDEAITARVDLKADRKAGKLLVLAAHAEPDANGETANRLAGELALMASWLGLSGVEVRPTGDLALDLGSIVRSGT